MGHNGCVNQKYALSAAAALVADPARAAILVALLDGGELTAGELARAASISPQCASLHLSKLVQGGMLVVQPRGRHRHYRMASRQVGFALEALGAVATRARSAAGLRTGQDAALCFARTCYDHLAGQLGVELAAALEREGVLIPDGERNYALAAGGLASLARWGLDVGQLRSGRRAWARKCLDWTERRPHVGGALGAGLLTGLFERGWLRRRRDTRAVRVTDRGLRGFTELGLSPQLPSR